LIIIAAITPIMASKPTTAPINPPINLISVKLVPNIPLFVNTSDPPVFPVEVEPVTAAPEELPVGAEVVGFPVVN